MILQDLYKADVLHPPKWLVANTVYLTIMGSEAYGASSGSSDIDVYGFCIPPKHIVWPHTAGVIYGFGDQGERFDQYQEHHVKHPSNEREYDFQIFSIVRYFHLCMENNPNALDSLFTPRRCVIHSTSVSEHVRQNRRLFLHKGSYHKFRGYAYAQLSKIKNKVNSSNPKRAADIEKNGLDTKFSYHVIRLALEAEQILSTHDIDLERDKEVLKSVRRGEWTIERIQEWFDTKERLLEELYVKSSLRDRPDERAIRTLLVECLEQHYGVVAPTEFRDTSVDQILHDLGKIRDKYSFRKE